MKYILRLSPLSLIIFAAAVLYMRSRIIKDIFRRLEAKYTHKEFRRLKRAVYDDMLTGLTKSLNSGKVINPERSVYAMSKRTAERGLSLMSEEEFPDILVKLRCTVNRMSAFGTVSVIAALITGSELFRIAAVLSAASVAVLIIVYRIIEKINSKKIIPLLGVKREERFADKYFPKKKKTRKREEKLSFGDMGIIICAYFLRYIVPAAGMAAVIIDEMTETGYLYTGLVFITGGIIFYLNASLKTESFVCAMQNMHHIPMTPRKHSHSLANRYAKEGKSAAYIEIAIGLLLLLVTAVMH